MIKEKIKEKREQVCFIFNWYVQVLEWYKRATLYNLHVWYNFPIPIPHSRTFRTVIDNLEFLVFDADGNDISDQIQNEALQPAFESAFGGFYEVVIDDDGSTDLNQKVK